MSQDSSGICSGSYYFYYLINSVFNVLILIFDHRLDYYDKAGEELLSRVLHRYFGTEPIGPNTLDNLIQGLNDEMMFHPIWRTIRTMLMTKKRENGKDEVFMFQYSHAGECGWGTSLGMGQDPRFQAAHFDEVILQFTNKVIMTARTWQKSKPPHGQLDPL